MAKFKKRIPRETTPKTILAVKVFKPLYKLLNDIHEGEVNEVGGQVVVESYVLKDYPYMEAADTIVIWCDLFDNMCQELNKPLLDTCNLRKISDSLRVDTIELNESDLNAAKLELDGMYRMWVRTPLDRVRSTLTQDTKDLMQEFNLVCPN